jgi:hypothetical protein
MALSFLSPAPIPTDGGSTTKEDSMSQSHRVIDLSCVVPVWLRQAALAVSTPLMARGPRSE